MESVKLKDQLILLCIHPEKGWVRKSKMVIYVLMAASMYDLALQGKLCISSGRIITTEGDTGDALLNELLNKVSGMDGKRLSWKISGLTLKSKMFYHKQLKYLEEKRLISSFPIEWLGITWGRRYRVKRRDHLKPLLNEMDRVLIYGRKPDLRLRLIIELLGNLGILTSFFPDGELNSRVKRKFAEISKQPFDELHETLTAIRTGFRDVLMMNHLSS